MKSYSKLELLKSKINGTELTGFWKILKPNYDYIEIQIPYYDYLRGEVFISDIKMLEDDADLDIGNLIAMVLLQFLQTVRKGCDLKKLGTNLLLKRDKYAYREDPFPAEELVKQDETSWSLEVVGTDKRKRAKMAHIKLRVKTSEIYRCEVFLHDLSQIIDDFDLSTEELIAVLYMDYMTELKAKGNNPKTIQQIVRAYEYYQEKRLI
ncbi:hypothetical protein [Bacillus sp. SM2101]|uniref:hypothetical protein n=1 Tax=Bacillus sp. SM2101 TaxID=2805366 RepID=UPI001BDEA954|nr:hypothetical protein [Bacillus sp. SM2101]